MKHWIPFGLLMTILQGCQAPGAIAPMVPSASGAIASSAAQTPAPRRLTASQVRHVQEAGGGTVWGLNFTQAHTAGNYLVWASRQWMQVWKESWTYSPNFSGSGELKRASGTRYAYRVPAGQTLILDQNSGRGWCAINGYGYSVPQANMYYAFEAGQLVVFDLYPALAPAGNYGYCNDDNLCSYPYESINLSGFTTSSSALPGLAANAGK